MRRASLRSKTAGTLSSRVLLPLRTRVPSTAESTFKATLRASIETVRASRLWPSPLPNTVDRTLDTPETTSVIARIVLETAQRHGVSIWRLPCSDGIRLATSEQPTSMLVDLLERAIAESNRRSPHLRLEMSRSAVRCRNNVYEFDQELFVSPAVAESVTIRPHPQGREAKDHLADRGVILEFIEEREGFFVVPMPAQGPRTYARDQLPRASLDDLLTPPSPAWPFPIDLVYTWVDSSDPVWQRDYESVRPVARQSPGLKAATNVSRWRSRDELRFSLRSVEMYAPFVRNIYIVTNGQRPTWLRDHPRVTVVSHESLYPDPSVLPTFNSNHIETVLHRIPGLAEHFLYLNDDFFFSRTSHPDDFFSIGGLGKLFFSPRFLGASPVLPTERATVACHKNTRDLLRRRFGIESAQKFQHAPYVMRRSVWFDIEREFAGELAATRSTRFRSRSDINGQFLYGHYALLTGQAYGATIEYRYLEVADGRVQDKIARMDRAGVKVFCLNDSNSDGDENTENERQIEEVLNARYPVPAAWETEARSGTPEATMLATGSQPPQPAAWAGDLNARTTRGAGSSDRGSHGSVLARSDRCPQPVSR